jgi:hypothetical protein
VGGETPRSAIVTVDDKKAKADDLREQMLLVIDELAVDRLAELAKHEYDEEFAVPEFRTYGQTFLMAGRDAFIAWVRREGRFPTQAEADFAATKWHREQAVGSQVADAYVSLALYYSAHAADAGGADIAGLTKVLDNVAGTLAYNLSWEYGPQV